jgi:adenylyl- and sulfurtransferase ThiI
MLWFPTRKTITAVMDGVQESATGSAVITLERVKGRVCFKLAWAGIGSPVAAHIYARQGGCAVLPLFVDTPKRKGCVKARKSLISTIANCPDDYYLKVHTERQPHGALFARLES